MKLELTKKYDVLLGASRFNKRDEVIRILNDGRDEDLTIQQLVSRFKNLDSDLETTIKFGPGKDVLVLKQENSIEGVVNDDNEIHEMLVNLKNFTEPRVFIVAISGAGKSHLVKEIGSENIIDYDELMAKKSHWPSRDKWWVDITQEEENLVKRTHCDVLIAEFSEDRTCPLVIIGCPFDTSFFIKAIQKQAKHDVKIVFFIPDAKTVSRNRQAKIDSGNTKQPAPDDKATALSLEAYSKLASEFGAEVFHEYKKLVTWCSLYKDC